MLPQCLDNHSHGPPATELCVVDLLFDVTTLSQLSNVYRAVRMETAHCLLPIKGVAVAIPTVVKDFRKLIHQGVIRATGAANVCARTPFQTLGAAHVLIGTAMELLTCSVLTRYSLSTGFGSMSPLELATGYVIVAANLSRSQFWGLVVPDLLTWAFRHRSPVVISFAWHLHHLLDEFREGWWEIPVSYTHLTLPTNREV